jgi:hypothetical protein
MPYKLFVFAIGGTGARVVKSLTMLLAAGVNLGEVSEIIPIIVDPHKANEDLVRTENLLRTYQRIRNTLNSKPKSGEFFSTEIKTLKNLVNNSDQIADTYTFPLPGVGNQKFRQYIDYGTLDPANQALAELLFSASNRETEMNIGFVGNPNIGSVVLNQFGESDELRQMAANFSPNDRIFIISSIFGGTGAAGFPIILKNIRGAHENAVLKDQNPEYLKNARIGALTALPYFGLEPSNDKRVQTATFNIKAKAALYYYARGVDKSVNRLYYIGDELTKNYDYDPGDGTKNQKNDAHLVELASALAIVDFARLPDADLQTADGQPVAPTYMEFSVRENAAAVGLQQFHDATLRLMARPLTRLALFSIYLTNRLRAAAGEADWTKDKPLIDSSFVNGSFVATHLNDFNTAFRDWLRELHTNKRGFQPFGADNTGNLTADPTQLIAGAKPKTGFAGFGGKIDFKDIDGELNIFTKKHKQYGSAEEKLLRAASHSLDTLLTNKFPDLFNPKTLPSDLSPL